MAEQEHARRLHGGVEAWNGWRREHPALRPDLSGEDLSKMDLRGINLGEADLKDAELFHADLGEAKLREANLTVGDLRAANLSRADITGADLRSANLEEASGADEEELGRERIGEILGGALDRGLDESITLLLERVWEWTGGAGPADDVSILAVEIGG